MPKQPSFLFGFWTYFGSQKNRFWAFFSIWMFRFWHSTLFSFNFFRSPRSPRQLKNLARSEPTSTTQLVKIHWKPRLQRSQVVYHLLKPKNILSLLQPQTSKRLDNSVSTVSVWKPDMSGFQTTVNWLVLKCPDFKQLSEIWTLVNQPRHKSRVFYVQ